ncbi:hypothetical protein TNCV_4085981 [Trichonephila clavipes]|nr:hypothetical protein TNCV_4085981 [Trichonephila clavipes]
MESNKKRFYGTHSIVYSYQTLTKGTHTKRKNSKQIFLSMKYALPLLQWLLRTVSPHSAPDCPTVLEVRVPIPKSAFVSVVGCSPEDVIVPQGVFPSPPTHVLWDLNQRKTLTDTFE